MSKENIVSYTIKEIEEMIDQNQLNDAVAHCKHILQFFPKNISTYRILGKSYLEAKQYKETAESFHSVERSNSESVSSAYELTYFDETGKSVTKRFDKVESTGRGKLLLNALTGDLESMGTAISEQEKRQILMEVLKRLC